MSILILGFRRTLGTCYRALGNGLPKHYNAAWILRLLTGWEKHSINLRLDHSSQLPSAIAEQFLQGNFVLAQLLILVLFNI